MNVFTILFTVLLLFGNPNHQHLKYCQQRLWLHSFTGSQQNHTARADFVVMGQLTINSKKHGKCIILYDDEDRELISKHKWYITKQDCRMYATSRDYSKGWKSSKHLSMHQLVMGFYAGDIDHKNRNGLDNRKKNLRKANRSQNMANSKLFSTSTTGYKGVSWSKTNKMFRAYIKVNYKQIWLGHFLNPIKAAQSYNEAAIKYFGEFARPNKIPE